MKPKFPVFKSCQLKEKITCSDYCLLSLDVSKTETSEKVLQVLKEKVETDQNEEEEENLHIKFKI